MSILDELERLRKRKAEIDATTVSIALFGQPGAGKSSLINRLTGQKLAKEGVRTDTTTEPARYDWNGLHLVDLPGYGTATFPGDTYAERFKIHEFDLFLCVFDGKLHQDDTRLFRFLKKLGKVSLFVRNKRDGIWEEGKTIEELEGSIIEDVAHQVGSPEKVYFTSCRTTYGLNDLEDAITEHLHDAKRERWYRSAQAFSEEFLKKKESSAKWNWWWLPAWLREML
jgi:GTP-binding protein EngB required for normal cell division